MAEANINPAVLKLLERADENLAEMEHLLKNNFYFGAANRGYYAIFHAISALLLHDKQEFQKHHAVISYFGKHYAKTGKAPKEFHQAFKKAFDIRQIADYDYEGIVTKDDAAFIRENAAKIIVFVKQYLAQSI
jgi:uncharacterized protein (UPF0332 family)